MSKYQAKCIIILSSKSSGSSALQNLLISHPRVKCISKTPHFEHETLFWTKAASILGMPQIKMLDSVVPISQKKAKSDLIDLLRNNLDSYMPPADDNELIFGGWKLLCEKYSPVFIEKSPHHLYQWSALELIANCIERLSEVKFLIIGLVRNPMDTLYSIWKRWGSVPEKNQYQWFTTYNNLLKFNELMKNKLIIIKYEDIVRGHLCLEEIYNFIDIPSKRDCSNYFHGESIGKWKKDKYYGFRLAEKVIRLAEKFGYSKSEMANDGNFIYPFYRHVSVIFSLISRFLR